MGKEFDVIDDRIRKWIGQQKMFFVATAPLAGDGLVNCSPKGMDTFRILGPKTIAYIDLTGSGIETIAHVKENGRIVIMMCAFEGPPKIFRFYGRGRVLPAGTPEYEEVLKNFETFPGTRAIVQVHVNLIRDSCGYSVPKYDYTGDRQTLIEWVERKGEDEIDKYKAANNRRSLDGLEGL